MKKLMIAMAAAAMVGAANAAATYNYYYFVWFESYAAKDTTPSAAHAGWYSAYCMTQGTAKYLLDTTKTVTYSDVAKWLEDNFAANSAAVVDAAQALTAFNGYDTDCDQYGFVNKSLPMFDTACNDYIGVVLFNNGTDLAYNVLSAYSSTTYKSFRIDDSHSECSSSGWQAVENAPEPTSGLLMLLGMAGLALKRKRA